MGEKGGEQQGKLGRGREVGERKEEGDDFFFSSRRRHTRYTSDWSSDVCSSDLCISNGFAQAPSPPTEAGDRIHGAAKPVDPRPAASPDLLRTLGAVAIRFTFHSTLQTV